LKASTAAIAICLGLALSGCATVDRAQLEARAALAPTGALRVGVYLGNPLSAIQDSVTGEMKGVALELGRELARRLGVRYEAVVYSGVGPLLEGAKSGKWDVALLQVSPARTQEFDFSPPIVEIELGYLVPRDSRISTTAAADAAGVRIAVVEKGQGDVILTGIVKRATLVRVPGLAAAMTALKAERVDAIASIKPSLYELSKQLPRSRVLDGRYATEQIAMAIPRGRDAGLPFMRAFVEEAKSKGLAKGAVERAGAQGALVAP